MALRCIFIHLNIYYISEQIRVILTHQRGFFMNSILPELTELAAEMDLKFSSTHVNKAQSHHWAAGGGGGGGHKAACVVSTQARLIERGYFY